VLQAEVLQDEPLLRLLRQFEFLLRSCLDLLRSCANLLCTGSFLLCTVRDQRSRSCTAGSRRRTSSEARCLVLSIRFKSKSGFLKAHLACKSPVSLFLG